MNLFRTGRRVVTSDGFIAKIVRLSKDEEQDRRRSTAAAEEKEEEEAAEVSNPSGLQTPPMCEVEYFLH